MTTAATHPRPTSSTTGTPTRSTGKKTQSHGPSMAKRSERSRRAIRRTPRPATTISLRLPPESNSPCGLPVFPPTLQALSPGPEARSTGTVPTFNKTATTTPSSTKCPCNATTLPAASTRPAANPMCTQTTVVLKARSRSPMTRAFLAPSTRPVPTRPLAPLLQPPALHRSQPKPQPRYQV